MFLGENTGLEEMKIFKFNTDFIFIFKRLIIRQHFIKKRKTIPWRCIFKCCMCLQLQTTLCWYPSILPQCLQARDLRQRFKGWFPVDCHPTPSLVFTELCVVKKTLRLLKTDLLSKLPCIRNPGFLQLFLQ